MKLLGTWRSTLKVGELLEKLVTFSGIWFSPCGFYATADTTDEESTVYSMCRMYDLMRDIYVPVLSRVHWREHPDSLRWLSARSI
ncbi:hypothetical protein J6590_015553 [Homalodisca vitripennis]|nr:hypothetical protein J6590_015553 [Homalodisca vitripennis]